MEYQNQRQLREAVDDLYTQNDFAAHAILSRILEAGKQKGPEESGPLQSGFDTTEFEC